VILGHPNCGKGYVCRRLIEHLASEIRGRTICIDLAFGGAITNEEEFFQSLSHKLKQSGVSCDLSQSDNLLEPLDALPVAQPVLFALNVDSLAHSVARKLLQEIRVRVEQGRLVAALTGEYDLQEMVHGPNSAFTAAGQYVLQGFNADEFGEYIKRHTDTFGIRWTEPIDDVSNRLFTLTGGNAHVARAITALCWDLRFRNGVFARESWSVHWIEDQLADEQIVGRLSQRILQHAIRLIPTNPNVWPNLEKLINNEPVTLCKLLGPPDPLTLSGIATRERDTMCFSSELMADAVRRYYDPRRLGDLYATAGRWNDAVERYKRGSPRDRLRPETALDRHATVRIQHVLASQMHQAALTGVEDVRRILVEACTYVYGFPEIVFWHRLTGWDPLPNSLGELTQEALIAGREILAESDLRRDNELVTGPQWEGAVFGCRLDGVWPDQPFAVLFGDFGGRELLSKERGSLAKELLSEFRDAHEHAVGLQRDRRLLQFRQMFERIAKDIVDALGSQILDVDGVLQSAAAGMRSLGYWRIFFSLVDPSENQINGVWEESADATFKLPERSKWLIKDANVDVQPFVVNTKQPLLIDDATAHPLTAKDIVHAANMKAIALIPLCTTGGRVMGTLHLEREDKTPVSKFEADEFMEFGGTLAALIEQGERIHLLQSALDKTKEPLLVVDACERVRYGNLPASELFPTVIPGRWRHAVAEASAPELNSVSVELRNALSGDRVYHHVSGIGSQPGFRGSLLAEPVHNRRREIAGAFVHIENLNYLYRVLDALTKSAGARDRASCMEQLLEATRVLGHRWGRLYAYDQATGELNGKRQFGFLPGTPEAVQFAAVRLTRDRGEPREETWMSIRSRQPVVFCYLGEDREFSTPLGMSVVGLANPHCSGVCRKRLNEYWIDLPLLAGSEILGKISLECDQDLLPEHWESLKSFAITSSVILEGFKSREESIRLEQAERSLAKLSHMIGSKYAWLSPAIKDYERLEGECPKLAPLNRAFRDDLRDLDSVLSRAKEMLRGIVPQFQAFDLAATLRECLSGVEFAVLDLPGSLPFVGDRVLLKSAFEEVFSNCVKVLSECEEKKLSVSAATAELEGAPAVRIVIADSGPGVPKGYKDEIFDDFFSYHPEGKLGTGLGLGLVLRVIRAHRGTIEENGTFGQGARFEIVLPRTLPAQLAEA